MTVAEMTCNLMTLPPENKVEVFGLDTFIIRVKGEMTDDVAGAAPWREWIELDAR